MYQVVDAAYSVW